jgi:hypothetical protein
LIGAEETVNEIDIFEDKVVLYTSNITQSIVKVYEMEQILELAILEAEQSKIFFQTGKGN